jgi:hypothetical protein
MYGVKIEQLILSKDRSMQADCVKKLFEQIFINDKTFYFEMPCCTYERDGKEHLLIISVTDTVNIVGVTGVEGHIFKHVFTIDDFLETREYQGYCKVDEDFFERFKALL